MEGEWRECRGSVTPSDKAGAVNVSQGTMFLKAGNSPFKGPEVGMHRALEENQEGGLEWFQEKGRSGDGKGGRDHRDTQVLLAAGVAGGCSPHQPKWSP